MNRSPKTGSSSEAIAQFFDDLASRGHEPLLRNSPGTLRLDLRGPRDEHWFVTVDRGDVTVSHRLARADAVMRTNRATFDDIVKGSVHVTAAFLRGVVEIEGDLGLLISFGRLFPGPPSSQMSFSKRQKVRER
jgi:predicted lipid carrier protein YhbT